MGKQIRLTESMILEAVNEILTDYNETSSNLKSSAKDALQSEMGFERWFTTQCLPNGIDKEQALGVYVTAKEELKDREYTNPIYVEKPDETPDFNQNIYDFNNGRYAMLAQRQDNNDGGWDRAVGKTKRPTNRQSRIEIDKYFEDDSRFDDIINEAIQKYTLQDIDDEDTDAFDTGITGVPKYRASWCIKKYNHMTRKYEPVSEERITFDTLEEAEQAVNDVCNKYKGCYAIYVSIEKEIDTLTGKRWEYMWHRDGGIL